MAEDKKKGYPKIPLNNWFLLREKFKQRTPEKVSPSYVATALSMGEASASANIIPPLKSFGLIDEAGKPTDLAYDWRDDEKYPQVCKSILEKIYPQELRDLFHGSDIDVKSIERWFARDAKVGESAARAYAATYTMLLDGDLSSAREFGAKAKTAGTTGATTQTRTAKKAENKPSKKHATPKPTAIPTSAPSAQESEHGATSEIKKRYSPNLHVDIQIHISPDSSAEQIDKIFESMAKHLPLKY